MYIKDKKGSKEDIKKLYDGYKVDRNKSECIRELLMLGVNSKDIIKELGVSINFISNKVSDLLVSGRIVRSEVIKDSKGNSSKVIDKDVILKVCEMYKKGVSVIDIMINFKLNRNNVNKILIDSKLKM